MQGTTTIWTIIRKALISIISAKFGKNVARTLGDVLWSNCGRRTTHSIWQTSNDHNSSTWANGWGELKISIRPNVRKLFLGSKQLKGYGLIINLTTTRIAGKRSVFPSVAKVSYLSRLNCGPMSTTLFRTISTLTSVDIWLSPTPLSKAVTMSENVGSVS